MAECKPRRKREKILVTIGGILLALYAIFMFSELVKETPLFLVSQAPFWTVFVFWVVGIIILISGLYLVFFINRKS